MGAALSEDIAQRKAKGQVIIVDRSPLAWVAYNAYGGQLEDKAAVFEASLKEFAHWQIDTLFVLEANQTQLYKRRRARGTKDYFEKQDKTYHTRVREGYEAGLAFLRKQKNLATKVLSIDANGTIDEIHESIARAVMM
jgi:thymidylate kinase